MGKAYISVQRVYENSVRYKLFAMDWGTYESDIGPVQFLLGCVYINCTYLGNPVAHCIPGV